MKQLKTPTVCVFSLAGGEISGLFLGHMNLARLWTEGEGGTWRKLLADSTFHWPKLPPLTEVVIKIIFIRCLHKHFIYVRKYGILI